MKTIGFFGAKQSGKNTCANIVVGIKLKQLGMVNDFYIDKDGKLIVQTSNASGELGWGEFDVTRKDPEFVEWAHLNMWPHVKLYSFADELKRICVDLFKIPAINVYGSDQDKNKQIEHLLWQNMPGVLADKTNINTIGEYLSLLNIIYHKPGPMTAREFMQFFGTEIMRKIWEPVWISNTMLRIARENSELAIITDVRFPNEVSAVNHARGYVAGLTRKLNKDSHASEPDVKKYKDSEIILIKNHTKEYTLDTLVQDITKLYLNLGL
jgi:hypothetical protein